MLYITYSQVLKYLDIDTHRSIVVDRDNIGNIVSMSNYFLI